MLPDWLERCLDFLAPRISAEALSSVSLDGEAFQRFTRQLIAERELRLKSEREQSVVLESPGRLFGNLNKVTPKLRFRLERCDDGRVRVEVFEHVVCSPKSPEAASVRRLCEEQLEGLLQLLTKWEVAGADKRGGPRDPAVKATEASRESGTLRVNTPRL